MQYQVKSVHHITYKPKHMSFYHPKQSPSTSYAVLKDSSSVYLWKHEFLQVNPPHTQSLSRSTCCKNLFESYLYHTYNQYVFNFCTRFMSLPCCHSNLFIVSIYSTPIISQNSHTLLIHFVPTACWSDINKIFLALPINVWKKVI